MTISYFRDLQARITDALSAIDGQAFARDDWQKEAHEPLQGFGTTMILEGGAVFERAGFEQIAPDIIQPADIFLERSGEDIRARTFVFTDPSGAEMCLRPDLTVPACRYHLSHAVNGGVH